VYGTDRAACPHCVSRRAPELLDRRRGAPRRVAAATRRSCPPAGAPRLGRWAGRAADAACAGGRATAAAGGVSALAVLAAGSHLERVTVAKTHGDVAGAGLDAGGERHSAVLVDALVVDRLAAFGAERPLANHVHERDVGARIETAWRTTWAVCMPGTVALRADIGERCGLTEELQKFCPGDSSAAAALVAMLAAIEDGRAELEAHHAAGRQMLIRQRGHLRARGHMDERGWKRAVQP
jgi:hypothetical protein